MQKKDSLCRLNIDSMRASWALCKFYVYSKIIYSNLCIKKWTTEVENVTNPQIVSSSVT